jgi:preprotein translocase subunit Sec61beta
MLLTSLITAAEETHTTEAAVSPIAVGGICLAVLLVMLIALLMFGKGREHS